MVYDYADSRAGEHSRTFLASWQAKLVCDDYGGYKAGFQKGITEIGYAAHARRRFFDLHASHSSQVAGQAMPFFAALYDIERDAAVLDAEELRKLRQRRAKPVCDALYEWIVAQRKLAAEGSAIAKALVQSQALGGAHVLSRRRARADRKELGRKPDTSRDHRQGELAVRRLSLRAGQRAAAIISLIRSAQLNVRGPHAYLKDILTRLLTHKASESRHCCRITGSRRRSLTNRISQDEFAGRLRDIGVSGYILRPSSSCSAVIDGNSLQALEKSSIVNRVVTSQRTRRSPHWRHETFPKAFAHGNARVETSIHTLARNGE